MAGRGGLCRYRFENAPEPAVYLFARDRAQAVNRGFLLKIAIPSLLAALLPVALGACASAAIPAAATLVQGGVAAAGYSAIQVGEAKADRHTPGALDDQEERCDALIGAAPGVEEVRKRKDDTIETRQ